MAKTDLCSDGPSTQAQFENRSQRDGSEQLSDLSLETINLCQGNFDAVCSYVTNSLRGATDNSPNKPGVYSVETLSLYCTINIGRLPAKKPTGDADRNDGNSRVKREKSYEVVDLSHPTPRPLKRRKVSSTVRQGKSPAIRLDRSQVEEYWGVPRQERHHSPGERDFEWAQHPSVSREGGEECFCSSICTADEVRCFRAPKCTLVEVEVGALPQLWPDILDPIQQKGLKRVIQYWIEAVHPQKQSKHPYNGGRNAKLHPEYNENNPGRFTSPVYWPNQDGWWMMDGTACRHREPHHLKKSERLCLAPHLLCLGNTYEDYDFSVDTLEAATDRITFRHNDDFPPGAEDYIKNMYNARRAYLDYESGGRDYNATVHVYMTTSKRFKAAHGVAKDFAVNASEQGSIESLSDPTPQEVSESTLSSFANAESGSEAGTKRFDMNDLHEVVESGNNVCRDVKQIYSTIPNNGSATRPQSPQTMHVSEATASEKPTDHRRIQRPQNGFPRGTLNSLVAPSAAGPNDGAGEYAQSRTAVKTTPKMKGSPEFSSSAIKATPTAGKGELTWPLPKYRQQSPQFNFNDIESLSFGPALGNYQVSGLQGLSSFTNDYLFDPNWYPTKYDIEQQTGDLNFRRTAVGATSGFPSTFCLPMDEDLHKPIVDHGQHFSRQVPTTARFKQQSFAGMPGSGPYIH